MPVSLVVRSVQPQEIEAAGELVARVFARGEVRRYERLLHHRLTQLPQKPGFSPGDYRGGFIDGKLVSVVRVVHHTLHYGQAWLKVAGIVDVATDPAYRHRGYSAAVLLDTLTYIAEQGAHLALLYDTTDYYRRFGFSPVLPDYTITFDCQDALPNELLLRLREARPDDLPALAALYQVQRDGKLMFRRTAEQWRWLYHARTLPPLIAEDAAGLPCGYLWQSPDEGDYTEVIAATMEATLTLMVQTARQQQQAGKKSVHWPLPPDDAVVVYAIPVIPVTIHAAYHPHKGWMGRLMHSQSLVHTLMPELTAQAKFVDPAFDVSRLILEVQSDVVAIGLKHSAESLCRLSHRDFIQVMFGSLRPAALAVRARLTAEQVRLLEMLFPPRMAALTAWDWF